MLLDLLLLLLLHLCHFLASVFFQHESEHPVHEVLDAFAWSATLIVDPYRVHSLHLDWFVRDGNHGVQLGQALRKDRKGMDTLEPALKDEYFGILDA